MYGFNTVVARRDLWNSLISWGMNNNEPWMLLGDFNSNLSIDDRNGSIPIANSNIKEFISCITTLGLEYAFSTGSRFTWTNGTHWAKLDRVLHNSIWSSLNMECWANFVPYNTLPEHTPILVSLSPQQHSLNKPFRFLNMWMTHPNFLSVVRNSWHTPVFRTKQYCLCMKLKALKPLLKSLNRQVFSHISERVVRAQEVYAEAQNLLMNNPTSPNLKIRVKEWRKHTNFLLEAERQFYHKKLKTKHLLHADRGTSYFYSLCYCHGIPFSLNQSSYCKSQLQFSPKIR